MTIDLATTKLRIDKWLWAARFFKTRSLAKAAIEGGKVHLGGNRIKVSKEISVGDELTIRQGYDDKVVIVKVLSDRRGGAPQAQTLYEESPASIAKREQAAMARKAAGATARPANKPDKQQRRRLLELRKQFSGIGD